MNNNFKFRLRFPEFRDKPTWANRKLSDVLFEHKEKSTGKEEVHSVSVHKGVINQIEHLGRTFAASNTENYKLVLPGDIIYTKSPTGNFPLGIIKQSKVAQPVIVSPLYGVFKPETIDLGLMLDAYFEYPERTINYLSSIVQKGAKNTININNDTFLSKSLILPTDKTEQQKIAACLSSLDDLITAEGQKLEVLKEHKKGLLQNLFPQAGETIPKVRFKEFEESGEWVEKKLGEICDVRDGTHDSPKYISEGYPMITSKNLLTNGMIDFENVSYLSEDDYIQINKRSKVDLDDILFGMIGTIGNPVIVKTDGFAIKNVALIKSSGKLYQEFLLHQLKSNYILNQFNKVNAGGILKFIALGVIRNLTVTVPSPKEQQKIASALSSVDELINAQGQKIEALQLHKKGLLQGLFPTVAVETLHATSLQQP